MTDLPYNPTLGGLLAQQREYEREKREANDADRKYSGTTRVASAFCKDDHRYAFRSGEYAEIVGVRMVKPAGADWRPCFVVRFKDGEEDLWPIHDETASRAFFPSCDQGWRPE